MRWSFSSFSPPPPSHSSRYLSHLVLILARKNRLRITEDVQIAVHIFQEFVCEEMPRFKPELVSTQENLMKGPQSKFPAWIFFGFARLYLLAVWHSLFSITFDVVLPWASSLMPYLRCSLLIKASHGASLKLTWSKKIFCLFSRKFHFLWSMLKWMNEDVSE